MIPMHSIPTREVLQIAEEFAKSMRKGREKELKRGECYEDRYRDIKKDQRRRA